LLLNFWLKRLSGLFILKFLAKKQKWGGILGFSASDVSARTSWIAPDGGYPLPCSSQRLGVFGLSFPPHFCIFAFEFLAKKSERTFYLKILGKKAKVGRGDYPTEGPIIMTYFKNKSQQSCVIPAKVGIL